MSHASGTPGERPVLFDQTEKVPDPIRLPPEPVGGLLDAVIAGTQPGTGPAGAAARTPAVAPVLEQFLRADSATALRLWLGRNFWSRPNLSRDTIARALGRDIARLDALLSRQVNAILHHPQFQQLEASWRGLWLLTGQAQRAVAQADQDGDEVHMSIRVLNVSKRELARDFDKVIEFDQSQLFKKVYEEQFGMAGGEPFGMLLGDYQFTNHVEDIQLLSSLSGVAAAAFAPFVAAATPQLLGLDNFATLEQPMELADTFNQLEYLKWRSFRDQEDSRFVGLTLPRMLMRVPYADTATRTDGFRFREDVEGADNSKYVWGNPAYALGAVLARAFASSGWFAEIRGVERDVEGGGLVTGLAVHSCGTDRPGIAPKISTDVAISDHQERELSLLGFVPLCHCKDTEHSVFYTNQSVQKPKTYDDQAATANARISAMLQYVMCASRFAHYLKVLARNKVGGSMREDELQSYLNNWIHRYVAADEKAPPATKARFPLREADIEVKEIPGKPGSYRLVIRLLPHFQLDELTATLRLVTTTTNAT